MQQYRDKDYNPGDRFSISPEDLETLITNLKKFFAFVMAKMVQQKNSIMQAQGNQQSVQDRQTQPPSGGNQGQTPELNAANLQQQQQALQAQLKLQRNESHRHNRAPAAPTAAQPPFLLGAQSPDGTPHAYGPTVLTQDQLKFPPPKKRKPNQQGSAASTPAQVQATPASSSSPQMVKIPSPESQRQQAVPQTFKCAVGSCDVNKNGFASQAELTKHTTDVHEPKEPPVEDPLAWAMESVRLGLGLDVHGKMKPRKEEPRAENKALEAPKMKLSASQQTQTPMKQEAATPTGQTAPPMSRAATQTGPSPASQMLKTPQASTHIKTPASATSGVKLETGKADSKPKSPAAATTTKSPPTPPQPDLWADSSISPASLSHYFSDLADMQSMPWSDLQLALTPPPSSSSPSSALSTGSSSAKSPHHDKNSPRASDIAETDALDLSIRISDDRAWWPSEWFEDFDEAGGVGGGAYKGAGFADVDWESAFGKMGVGEEGAGVGMGKGMGGGNGNGNGKKGEWAEVAGGDPMVF